MPSHHGGTVLAAGGPPPAHRVHAPVGPARSVHARQPPTARPAGSDPVRVLDAVWLLSLA
ncbi:MULTISPECIES: hypothetical protein [Micromonospora]|uniref:hypothetical protein n=1 Tax=Micromonospora TaxID=1873 RepID=UPI000C88B95F|nr:hypothetical protein [Verrucosispora sp. ts21]PMR60912.1 hypothetical protein C1A38_11665 [Verrucosispora sp. ts21]